MKKTPLRRKKPLRAKYKIVEKIRDIKANPLFVGTLRDDPRYPPFTKFKIVKHKHGPIGSTLPPFPKLYRGGNPRRPGDLNYVGPQKPTAAAIAAWKRRESAKPPKPRAKLPPISKKRAVLNKQYEAAKRAWRQQHDGRCEMRFFNYFGGYKRMALWNKEQSFRCREKADRNPHHMKRRGPFLCDTTTFLGLCFGCHTWLHQNEEEARRLGYLLDRPAKSR